ncbi:MAG: ATPase, T2SS/T4P/T4SS family [Capsulimonadaceae bacterium]
MTDEHIEAGAAKEDLLTIDEAAKFLDTSKSTLYRLLGQGDLKGTKVGKQWRFRKSDLTAYLARGPEAVSMDTAARADLDGLLAGRYHRDISADTTDEEKVVHLVHNVIREAVQSKASDIHMEPMELGIRVRFRIDGVLHEAFTIPRTVQDLILTRVKFMADMNLMEKRVPQDGIIPLKIDGMSYDARTNCLPTFFGESIVMHILDKATPLLGIDKLDFSDHEVRTIDRWLHRNGLIVATGPGNSGKTTVLYSLLSRINAVERKLITIEDPIECQLAGTNQIAVNRRAGLTFAAGLRSCIRQDPDVIMIAQLRDQESALLTVEAALTGHLVMTTLHTEDAPSALIRLADMGIEKYLVSATAVGIIAGRLCRRLCSSCKTLADPIEAARTLEKVRDLSESGGFEILDKSPLYEPVGCDQCRHTGYRGRVGIHEVLNCEPRLTAQLLQCATTAEMSRLAVDSGMRTLFADGMCKAVAGETSVDEVLRTTAVWL